MFQIQPTHNCHTRNEIPPTAVGGYFRSSLHDALNRQDLNHPPTSVGGIPDSRATAVCRLDLKHPPTAVGGILPSEMFQRFCTFTLESGIRKRILELKRALTTQ